MVAVAMLVGAIAGGSLYVMNASFSVADSRHEDYYRYFTTVWGLVGIAGIAASVIFAILAWRSRKQ